MKSREGYQGTCCCGVFTVTGRIFCGIPWFKLSRGKTLDVRPIAKDPAQKAQELNPSNVHTYQDVLKMYQGEVDILPTGDGQSIVANRPHRPSLLLSKPPCVLN